MKDAGGRSRPYDTSSSRSRENSSDQVAFSARNSTIPGVSGCEVVVVPGASVGVAFP